MTTAFLAWRAPESRRWYAVGRLTADPDSRLLYRFEYTGGAEEARRDAGFAPLASFPDLGARYVSEALFPFFSNRLLPRSRPEYAEYVRWLSVPEVPSDPLALLAQSGGKRETDVFELYPCPERDAAGGLRLHFFVHGIGHLPPEAAARAERLTPGESLLLMHDFQNAYDRQAFVLRTAEKVRNDFWALGFLPRYLVMTVHDLLRALDDARLELPRIVVERVNPSPAPVWFRVLCRLTSNWPNGYRPFSDAAHQPLGGEREITVGGRLARRSDAARVGVAG